MKFEAGVKRGKTFVPKYNEEQLAAMAKQAENEESVRYCRRSSHTLVAHACPGCKLQLLVLLHCKKRLLIFPSPAGMSLTK